MTAAGSFRQNSLYDEQGPRAIWISSLSSPQCRFAHKISSRPTGTYAVHDHPSYELLYVVSGQVEFFIAGHVFAVGGGTLLTFPPGVMHGVLVRTDSPYERYTLHFDPQVLSMERRRLLLRSMPSDLLGVATVQQGQNAVWEKMESSGVLRMLEAMEGLRGTDPEMLSELMPIYLEGILAALIPHAAKKRSSPTAPSRPLDQLEQIISWVDQHYTESISLESLAEKFFLSKGYLSTLFRQATGSSVKDYVRARRMAHVRLLLASGMNASQAASRVGFSDYTTFYRAYMRSFGHAPSHDCDAGHDVLLEQALTAQAKTVEAVDESEGGTEKEDPSMINAVWANPEDEA